MKKFSDSLSAGQKSSVEASACGFKNETFGLSSFKLLILNLEESEERTYSYIVRKRIKNVQGKAHQFPIFGFVRFETFECILKSRSALISQGLKSYFRIKYGCLTKLSRDLDILILLNLDMSFFKGFLGMPVSQLRGYCGQDRRMGALKFKRLLRNDILGATGFLPVSEGANCQPGPASDPGDSAISQEWFPIAEGILHLSLFWPF